MHVRKQQSGSWVPVKTLSEALDVDFSRKQVISAVGGGGKTAALHCLAEELAASGKKVILTTSTHMMMPETADILTSDPAVIAGMLEENHFAIAGIPAGDGKMAGIPEGNINDLITLADVVLVEADGSRQLPLKLPADYEPVIPFETTHVLVLAGMNAIGRRVCDVCHRPERVKVLIKAEDNHLITPTDAALILKEGYWIPHVENMHRTGTVILNQADDGTRYADAVETAALLNPIPCLITQLKEMNTHEDIRKSLA